MAAARQMIAPDDIARRAAAQQSEQKAAASVGILRGVRTSVIVQISSGRPDCSLPVITTPNLKDGITGGWNSTLNNAL